MQRLHGARLGRADGAAHQHVRVLDEPGVVVLERVVVEAVEAGGDVDPEVDAGLAEAAVGVERVHRAQVRHRRTVPVHRDRLRRAGPATAAGPSSAGRSLAPCGSRRARGARRERVVGAGLGGPQRTLRGAALADHARPALNDRPNGSDATHPCAWRATSGRRSISDLPAAFSIWAQASSSCAGVVGGHGDQAGVTELGMAAGQLPFAALDVGEAATFPGRHPEPAAGLVLVRRLDRGQVPVGGGRRLVQRDRLVAPSSPCGSSRCRSAGCRASWPAPAASAAAAIR